MVIPQPGMVLNYSILWAKEAREWKGRRREGSSMRDRSCHQNADEQKRVWVVPITHSPPRDNEDAIETPAAVKLRLGLDSGPSWAVIIELNEFVLDQT